jgi:hypothetical protein
MEEKVKVAVCLTVKAYREVEVHLYIFYSRWK